MLRIFSKINKLLMLCLAMVSITAIGWFGAQQAGTTAAGQLNDRLKERVTLYNETLQRELDQLQLVGRILSQNPTLQQALKKKAQPKDILKTNGILKETNQTLHTSAVYLMNAEGRTVAASNFDQPNSFIGKNYSFRPYFKEAVLKAKGQFLAIGITSNKLGFYIAHSIYSAKKELIGVVVIKVDLNSLHQYTKQNDVNFLIADERDIIFLTSNPSFTLKSLRTLSAKDRLYITRTRQYPVPKIQPLNNQPSDIHFGTFQAYQIEHKDYFIQKSSLNKFGWKIWVMSPVQSVTNQAFLNGFAIAFVTAMALLAFYLIYKRKKDAAHFQTIVDNLPSGVTFFDNNQNMLLCNEMVKKVLDFPDSLFKSGLPSLEKLIQFNIERGEYEGHSSDEVLNKFAENINKRVNHVFERTRPDGTILEIRGVWVENGLITTYTDITDRKKAEEEAKRTTGYLRALLQNLDLGVTVIDENLNIIFWNNAFFDLLNFPRELEKPVMKYEDLIRYNAERGEYGPGDPEQHVQMRIQASLKFEPHKFERTRPDGRTLQVSGKPLYIDEEPFGFISTYIDITEHKRMASRLRTLANTDALTEIHNRRHFTTLLEGEIKRCKRNGNDLSLLLLDLDHFKAINDSFGHSVGDQALKRFSETCRKLLRDIDVMGRLGGEEFCIFLPDTNRDGALALAERIRYAVEKIDFSHDEDPIPMTVSIGLSLYDSMLKDRMEDMIKRADKALRRAKKEGRNRVC
ncbi:PAS-domain containing protein [Terasakiella sp. SH-1]|uniref:PAS-domain containing protein n=1 Tax=Terasakiella sp. SH-1 TaxID=2560057 RepID=UPI001073F6C8|nr:PAS-domain containing protein [Terasakiella sp. SH-1]